MGLHRCEVEKTSSLTSWDLDISIWYLRLGREAVMKLGILTINDKGNYGNRLQNYAMQQLLTSFGEALTIRTVTVDKEIGTFKRLSLKIKFSIGNLISYLPIHHRIALNFKRMRNYNKFDKRIVYFDKTIHALQDKNITGFEQFDYIVIGSDQVWNYTWFTQNDMRMRLGMFANANQLISYAASIGRDTIDQSWSQLFSEGWARIKSLSVREDRAAELVKELTGRTVPVVLDPTLMMCAEDWKSEFRGFVEDGDKYVLTYFLSRPSEAHERVIQDYASSHGLRIRRLNDLRDPETHVAGPAEFVELFSKAAFVFTDSYHACCFSLNFNTGFKVFNRTDVNLSISMNSRMRTLFRLFKLEDTMGEESDIPAINWHQVNELMCGYREESRKWLEMALGL